jgi:hypothetical protein
LPTPDSPINTGLFLVRSTKYLDQPLDLSFAADQRIQFSLCGIFGQIAGKFYEIWCSRAFRLYGRHRRKSGPTADLVADVLRTHSQSEQYLRPRPSFPRVPYKQKVLGADMAAFQMTALFAGVKQDAFLSQVRGEARRIGDSVAKYDAFLDVFSNGINGKAATPRENIAAPGSCPRADRPRSTCSEAITGEPY